MHRLQIAWKKSLRRKVYLAFTATVFAFAFVIPARTAESPGDPKRFAFDVVDRNADQIATVGDVLYYFAEPGMQEYESAKFVKETLESAGFKVELGGAGMLTNVWATWGSGKPVIAICDGDGRAPRGITDSGKHSAEAASRRRTGSYGRS